MRGTCIYSWFGFEMPMEERYRLIKNAGFDSAIIWWGDEYEATNGPKEKQPDAAVRNGLHVENAHLSFSNANEIWKDSPEAEDVVKVYERSIEDCSNYSIPTVVLHLTCGKTPPETSKIGIERMKRLVSLAERKNVNIAVENLRRTEYNELIFSNIQSDRLGFCYDSGHENCFTKGTDFLIQYGSKLMALHLHDNDGTDDQHMIPGEGLIDWNTISCKLKATGFKGPASLEVTCEKSKLFGKETPEEFLARAYEAAKMILG